MVKFKKLAGGGYFKIMRRIVSGTLQRSRNWSTYGSAQFEEIVSYMLFGHGTIGKARRSNHNDHWSGHWFLVHTRAGQIESGHWRRALTSRLCFNSGTLGRNSCTQVSGHHGEKLNESDVLTC